MAFEKINQSFGDDVVPGSVTINGITEEFKIKRLPNIEMDKLRASNINDSGVFSAEKSVGYRARVVAATIIVDDHYMSAQEVEAMKDELVLALYEESAKVNGLKKEAIKTASKNSDSSPTSGS